MILYETVMDDGGAPALQIDHHSDFAEVLHESGTYPLTIVTEDTDGNEIRRRILANVDDAIEDKAILVAQYLAMYIRERESTPPEAVQKLLDLFKRAVDDPGTPEEELPFFIAMIRGLDDS